MSPCRRSRRPSRSHRWLSGGLVVAWLLMQMALAAYACPRDAAGPRAVNPPALNGPVADGPVTNGPVTLTGMADCAGTGPGAMDPAQPLLCKAHCEQDAQALQPSAAAEPVPAPVLWLLLDWAPAMRLAARPAGTAPQRPAGAAPPGTPALYLTLQVLRN